jgi:hypothetical protein
MTFSRMRSIVGLSATLVLVVGCGLFPVMPPAPGDGPRPCVALHSADRCQAMLTVAAEQLGVLDDDVSSISIDPNATAPPGVPLGGGWPTTVLVEVGGTVRKASMCGGIPIGPACDESPEWTIESAIGAGYEDVPCAGEAPNGCASPLPTLAPDAIRDARPLKIESRSIDVPAVGPYRIRLGDATLANGILKVAHGTLADPWPDHVHLSSAGIRIEVVSQVAGRPPFENLYQHGWWPGAERVDVFLVFEARHVDPGATIEVRDLLVG